MFSKTTNIIIGLLLVTGTGFLFASTRNNTPAQEPAPAAQTAAPVPEDNSAPTDETIGQSASVVSETSETAASQPQTTQTAPQPASSPQPTPSAAPAPQETPKQTSSPASTAGLEGLWKLERELTIDNATGNVIREDHFLIYTSFKGSEQCLNVRGTENNLSCASGYFPITLDANGVITDADGFDNYRYQNGALEAIYVQKEITKRQIFKKVSAQPVR